MRDNGIPNDEMAARLGVDVRTLSAYKSRGLPRNKWQTAKTIMAVWGGAPDEKNRICVELTDEEFSLIDAASSVVEAGFKEYCIRAIISKARSDYPKAPNTEEKPPRRKVTEKTRKKRKI